MPAFERPERLGRAALTARAACLSPGVKASAFPPHRQVSVVKPVRPQARVLLQGCREWINPILGMAKVWNAMLYRNYLNSFLSEGLLLYCPSVAPAAGNCLTPQWTGSADEACMKGVWKVFKTMFLTLCLLCPHRRQTINICKGKDNQHVK